MRAIAVAIAIVLQPPAWQQAMVVERGRVVMLTR